MHAHHQHFFLVGAVKDADFSARWETAAGSPQEIVPDFLTRRCFERKDLHALWIYAGHDVFDRSVFAGRVHGLENQQQPPTALRVEHILHLAQKGNALLQPLFRFGLFFGGDSVRVAGIVIF
jgi:hypothetical protein